MENALVTGGAGFIGSSLVRGLLADDQVQRVVVVDNLDTGKTDNLEGLDWSKVEIRKVDVRDYDRLEACFSGVDVVFHEAAVASVPRSVQEPVETHCVNIDGTFNVLRAAAHKHVRRVVFAASSAAYGNNPETPKRETMCPDPQSPYAVQKLAGEYYLKTFWENYGLETVALRYFNVFGPRQDPSSPYSGVLSIFAERLLSGEQPTIHGDGEQTRDFIFVDDIVRLNLLAARAEGAAGKVYNGGRGEETSLNQMWKMMQHSAGVDMEPKYVSSRSGDIRRSVADITRAREELAFEPKVDLQEGVAMMLDWYRTQRRA